MSTDRVEVVPGPGTAIRFGRVAIWAGPGASRALLLFLLRSARNVGESSRGGRQLVDHITEILSSHDPEPGASFVAVGPADGGWVAILHGPVQLWDGVRWLAPSPTPGWLSSPVDPRPSMAIGPAGASVPTLHPDSPFDLEAGMVPGGGLLVVPDRGGSAPGSRVEPDTRPAEPPLAERPPDHPHPAAVGTPPATGAAAADPDPVVATLAPRPERAAPAGPFSPAVPSSPAAASRTGPTDLRAVTPARRPPLPPAAEGLPAPPGRPEVEGVRCEAGHFNHRRAAACGRCGRSLADRPPESGPRPPLGVLIGDDGTVYRVERDLVIGSDPHGDPSVAGGRAVALVLRGLPGAVAPAHTEIRLDRWALSVADRGSAGGTFFVPPGRTDWERLPPFQPRRLTAGCHLSLGQRVLTYVSPWPPEA
ncbi:MAG TPA: hypothetical protein VKV25_04085 [Acidimicrobiales bacterium]|nr:hypothetical protein [Acidimicrobiales bacterium]